MNDSPNKLEQELLALRPRKLQSDLIDRVEESISAESRPFSDWCLMGAIGSGLAAACVIVGLLSVGLFNSTPNTAVGASPVAEIVPQRAGDSLAMFARADGDWNGILK